MYITNTLIKCNIFFTRMILAYLQQKKLKLQEILILVCTTKSLYKGGWLYTSANHTSSSQFSISPIPINAADQFNKKTCTIYLFLSFNLKKKKKKTYLVKVNLPCIIIIHVRSFFVAAMLSSINTYHRYHCLNSYRPIVVVIDKGVH